VVAEVEARREAAVEAPEPTESRPPSRVVLATEESAEVEALEALTAKGAAAPTTRTALATEAEVEAAPASSSSGDVRVSHQR
jgi:hypothetical protein